MIGDAILYAVQRATSTAVGNVERKVAWTAAAGALLLCALVAALVVVYQLLEPRVGISNAVALISVACLLIGLFCLLCPIGSTVPSVSRPRPVAVLRQSRQRPPR